MSFWNIYLWELAGRLSEILLVFALILVLTSILLFMVMVHCHHGYVKYTEDGDSYYKSDYKLYLTIKNGAGKWIIFVLSVATLALLAPSKEVVSTYIKSLAQQGNTTAQYYIDSYPKE